MTKRMSVREARANFSDLIGSVFYTQEPVVIEKKGRPTAVVISPELFEQFQTQVKAEFFRTVRELQDLNANKDPDQVLRDVTEAVEEVRREHYEREQLAATRDR